VESSAAIIKLNDWLSKYLENEDGSPEFAVGVHEGPTCESEVHPLLNEPHPPFADVQPRPAKGVSPEMTTVLLRLTVSKPFPAAFYALSINNTVR